MVLLHAPPCSELRIQRRKGNVMTAPTPCYRHPRGVWIASCHDCTAWHLVVAVGRRALAVPTPTTAAAPGTTAPVHLRLVA